MEDLPEEGQWLAGFYFNSALQRLAAFYHRALKVLMNSQDHDREPAPSLAKCAERLGLLKHDEIEALQEVHTEVNKLKHARRSALPGREVKIETAVRAAEQAERLFKRALETKPGGKQAAGANCQKSEAARR